MKPFIWRGCFTKASKLYLDIPDGFANCPLKINNIAKCPLKYMVKQPVSNEYIPIYTDFREPFHEMPPYMDGFKKCPLKWIVSQNISPLKMDDFIKHLISNEYRSIYTDLWAGISSSTEIHTCPPLPNQSLFQILHIL